MKRLRSNSIWLVSGVMLSLTGCTRADPGAVADAPGDTAVAAQPVSGGTAQPVECEGLELTILRTVAQRARMRELFGAPDSVRSTIEPNRHIPDVTDSLFDLYYSGFTAHIRKPHRGDDMPVHVRASDNRYLRYSHIGIGASPDALVRSLGAPTSRRADALVYDCGPHTEQPVIFHLNAAGGRVSSVEIQYYVD